MARILFERGARGDTIRQIQQRLREVGCDPNWIDGIFGNSTQRAVAQFQVRLGLPKDGIVDDITWLALMRAPLPAEHEHDLRFPVPFEHHDYVLAQGNFD